MASLKQLAARMNRAADNLESVGKQVRDSTANFLVKTLIERTPVDTSRALSNWRVTTGAIMPYIPPLSAGQGGSTQAASAAMAISAAAAAIQAASPSQVLVIFNSVPYIRRLNDGYSAQAPAGFVEAAILLARIHARTVKIDLGR